jgi:hypothetical protein
MTADRGIVKAGAALFKKIRYTTAKTRFAPGRDAAGRQFRGPMLVSVSIDRERRFEIWPDGSRGGIGCQVHHAPFQARGAPEMVAPKHREYMDTLNNALTCVVLFPI